MVTIHEQQKASCTLVVRNQVQYTKAYVSSGCSTCQRDLDASVSAWCLKQLRGHDTVAVPCRVEAIGHWAADIMYQV